MSDKPQQTHSLAHHAEAARGEQRNEIHRYAGEHSRVPLSRLVFRDWDEVVGHYR